MKELLALGGCLVVVSAIMAALGYRGRDQIVGIDLGTTFSVVAVKSNNQVKILSDRITGNLLVPSVVHYAKNGSVIVGEAAVKLRSEYPLQTIYNSKRFIGRLMQEVADDAGKHRYQVSPNASRSDEEKEEDVAAGFTIPGNSSIGSFWRSPIDVASEVVAHLKRSVTHAMGYEMQRAVICVPAKFTQREDSPLVKATVDAFNQGGIKVMRVLEEPTAAAIAYNLHKTTGVRHVLVYDIGGGTLDTSLLYTNGKTINVMGVAGDDHLGGSDFDHRMQAMLEARLDGAKEVASEPSLPDCSHSGLGVPAEKAKIALSSAAAAEVKCRSSDGRTLSMSVSREEFEAACKDLFDRAIAPVEQVLEDQYMGADDVDDIVLVGGASRMPQLRILLGKFFGNSKRLHTEIDPDVTVAYGAANIID
jgi:molecular chaperone DnaK (HSP70)